MTIIDDSDLTFSIELQFNLAIAKDSMINLDHPIFPICKRKIVATVEWTTCVQPYPMTKKSHVAAAGIRIYELLFPRETTERNSTEHISETQLVSATESRNKVSSNGDVLNPGEGRRDGRKYIPIVVVIAAATVVVLFGLIYLGVCAHPRSTQVYPCPLLLSSKAKSSSFNAVDRCQPTPVVVHRRQNGNPNPRLWKPRPTTNPLQNGNLKPFLMRVRVQGWIRYMGAYMETMSSFHVIRMLCFCLLLVFQICIASPQYIGQIHPGFQGSQMNWIDNNGFFLRSNNSIFALGFFPALDVKSFLLVIIHMGSSKAVWTANRGLLVRNSDKFVFDKSGNVYLEMGDGVAWSTNTTGERVTGMELWDNGNLVLLDNNKKILWQSFRHPTDTLLPGQEFVEGMNLTSFPRHNTLVYNLEVKSGDLILYVGFQTPQLYWSMENESRKTIYKSSGKVYSASLMFNSWNLYDQNRTLIWKFNFTEKSDQNATWAAVLGYDGSMSFYNLQEGKLSSAEQTKIPQNSCSLPESCDPYNVCSFDNRCQCPSPLSSFSNCKPQTISTCNNSKGSVELLFIGEKLNYFTLGFVKPFLKSDLSGCKEACLHNCSCLVLFFEDSSGNCFLFDQIGNFQRSDLNSTGFISYIKVSSNGDGLDPIERHRNGRKHVLLVVVIPVAAVLVLFVLLYLGFWYLQKRKRLLKSSQDISEEDDFLESLSGIPVRFNYNDICSATNNFSVKLGKGGFGSVYQAGRKNYDLEETSEKAHLPSYALKMVEGGQLKEILDSKLNIDENDERVGTAIKVALWCIQDDMHLRPPMTKVVQMLEGICAVPHPPTSPHMSSYSRSSFFDWSSVEATLLVPTDCNSGARMSDIRLSGPR
ncbi:hypothetical protein L1049_004237 [Liquidambar formosana]|uniref:Receptor-like serine/threonine-protein kinase n=1 Tax=Liquidambar formosana TaxID=63359 RepID=A0AAP0RP57_LIQFO